MQPPLLDCPCHKQADSKPLPFAVTASRLFDYDESGKISFNVFKCVAKELGETMTGCVRALDTIGIRQHRDSNHARKHKHTHTPCT